MTSSQEISAGDADGAPEKSAHSGAGSIPASRLHSSAVTTHTMSTSNHAGNEWARYLRELADAQVKQQIAVNLRQAAEEIERLQAVFDEASAEVRLSHNTPCFCKYCREPNDAGNTAGSESPASPRAAGTGPGKTPRCVHGVLIPGYCTECVALFNQSQLERPCGCRTDIAGAAVCEERTGFPGSYCLMERQREEALTDEQVTP